MYFYRNQLLGTSYVSMHMYKYDNANIFLFDSDLDPRVQRDLLGEMHWKAEHKTGPCYRDVSEQLCGSIYRYIFADNTTFRSDAAKELWWNVETLST